MLAMPLLHRLGRIALALMLAASLMHGPAMMLAATHAAAVDCHGMTVSSMTHDHGSKTSDQHGKARTVFACPFINIAVPLVRDVDAAPAEFVIATLAPQASKLLLPAEPETEKPPPRSFS